MSLQQLNYCRKQGQTYGQNCPVSMTHPCHVSNYIQITPLVKCNIRLWLQKIRVLSTVQSCHNSGSPTILHNRGLHNRRKSRIYIPSLVRLDTLLDICAVQYPKILRPKPINLGNGFWGHFWPYSTTSLISIFHIGIYHNRSRSITMVIETRPPCW